MSYLDNNATTKISPEVLDAMSPFLEERYGNPSSIHRLGQQARKAVNEAREKVASFLGVRYDSEIIFTSGGTESNNLALRGFLKARPEKRHLITTKVEHPSVLNVFKELAEEGYAVTFLDVDSQGTLNLEQLKSQLSSDTALVSVMFANNETGVIFPIEEVGQYVRECGAVFHVDAVQAAGKIRLMLQESTIDLLSVSGHKIHAPKGAGALYVRKGIPLASWIVGGAQEREKRGGTENVASIVGLGKACELANFDFDKRNARLRYLRDKLEQGLLSSIPDSYVSGARENRVSNTTNLSFKELDSDSILLALDEEGISASSGSACSTGSVQFSHVLLAMGFSEWRVGGAIRFSLSQYNEEEEIDDLIKRIPLLISRLRAIQTSEV